MTVFRSYFSKSNTIVNNNRSNNSQNPVTEISYGTFEDSNSRFIFDIDLDHLIKKIEKNELNPVLIDKHVLHLTNTIAYSDVKSTKSYDSSIDRASSFTLEVFEIDESWDEGNGYDFNYIDTESNNANNWYDRKTSIPWSNEGIYDSGSTTVIGEISFSNSVKNIDIDITDYINRRLVEYFTTGNTGTTGNTTFGLGIKFIDELELLDTINRQAVAFFTNNTHTFFHPYVETIVSDNVSDDRNYFFQDKNNELFLSINPNVDAFVESVNILDHNENIIDILSGDSVILVKNGLYKIIYDVDSNEYPDDVIFYDEWNININGKSKKFEQEFFILNWFNQHKKNDILFDNFNFKIKGILENEDISKGDVRKVIIDVKNLYKNQDENTPLNLKYSIYIKETNIHRIDVIPFTDVNRIGNEYFFYLDTTWMIPQDYYLEVKLSNDSEFKTYEPKKFKII